MIFNIGDRVRLEHDHPGSIWVVMMVYEDTGRIGILHSTKDGSQMLWVNPSRLTLVDRHADLKQAIREVLLSDEFLSAFAKAFTNTPIPSTIQYVSDLSKGLVKAWTCEDGKAKQVYPEPKWTPQIGDWVRIKKPVDAQASASIWVGSMNKYDGQVIQVKEIEEVAVVHEDWGFLFSWLEPAEPPKEQPQPPDGWRFLNVGEVIRKGDRCFTNNSGSIDCITSVGEKFNREAHYPTIRRNRFEVGEKVVERVNNRIGVVKDIEAIGSGKYFLCHVEMQDTKGMFVFSPHQLAPYIEETT